MSFALSAGVTGLQAHQKMLDIAGNNLANVNTTAFKAKTINFSELMTETIKKASQPTATVGGTNPQQMGGGVEISSISPNMAQGNIVNTGSPLDLALEGDGYLAARDGSGVFRVTPLGDGDHFELEALGLGIRDLYGLLQRDTALRRGRRPGISPAA